MTKNGTLVTVFFFLLLAGLISSNPNRHFQTVSPSVLPLSEPDPAKAYIYVYRSSLYGALNSFELRKDGRRAGYTNYGQFVRWEVTPGLHRISSEGGDLAILKLDAEAGNSYFIEETVIGGFTLADIRPRLKVVDRLLGENSVQSLRAVL